MARSGKDVDSLCEKGSLNFLPLIDSIGGRLVGDAPSKIDCSGVTCDTRELRSGDAFFCLEGGKFDGNHFIAEAVKTGAACIVSEREPQESVSVPFVVVSDARLALAVAAAQFYGQPSSRLRMIGVTGTNGKTTSTHLIERILLAAGNKVGVIGTLGTRWTAADGPMQYLESCHTTPQAPELQALLSEMVEKNVTHLAMEVSSHALALKRVAACDFAVACLTNVTQDHLDFHKTMDEYWKAKRILFEQLLHSNQKNKSAVVNADDPLAQQFIDAVRGEVSVLTYGWSAPADIHVLNAEFDFRGTRLSLSTPKGNLDLKLHLNGKFNVYNVMTAVAVAIAEGVSLSIVKEALEDFWGVAGRFERVATSRETSEPLCLVDYAHTPDGLENVLNSARALVPEGGKLIAVFGCGGDRDNTKRPKMGAIADRLSDVLFVTSDNPRTEDPDVIIKHILAGIGRSENITVDADRASAIKQAVLSAAENDIVVVAGKGHETYQILKDCTIDFDDRIEVKKALELRK